MSRPCLSGLRSGELVFLCNCNDGYQNYACAHSVILSMLWNPKPNYSYVGRAAQLKAKEVKKSSTPFDAVNKQKKKQNKRATGEGQCHCQVESSNSKVKLGLPS